MRRVLFDSEECRAFAASCADQAKAFSEPGLMERGPLPLPLCRQQDRAIPALNLSTLSDRSDRGRGDFMIAHRVRL
jgi:hypothetical protein